MSTEFKRSTEVRLPFDMRERGYGIGGLDIWFILQGPLGAVQFACSFPIFLPSVDTSTWSHDWKKISGIDVGYHSPKPRYEGQTPMKCELLECGECYYDGSALRADDFVKEIFSVTGKRPEEVLWRELEFYYKETFVDE